MGTPINQEDNKLGLGLIFQILVDPTVVAYSAPLGAIAILANPNGSYGLFQKMDEGKTTNWTSVGAGHTHANLAQLNTFLKSIDSSAIGDQKALVYDLASDKLIYKTVGGGGAAFTGPYNWTDLQLADGKVLPISQPRGYYPCVLYNATPMFFDGTTLRKYVAYYAGAASAQGYAAFSDDGIAWDTETLVTGVTGLNYHVSAIIVSGIIHYFYWNTTASIYSAAAICHATFNPAVSCVASTSNAVLTGGYIYGASGSGNIRAGTYGFTQVFYNPAPTSNPANPYSYPWCAIVQGTDGSQESGLFATSADGYNFSPWNALQEVIPRGTWDAWIGTINTWIDTAGLWHAFYAGGLGTGGGEDTNFGGGLGYATSVDGITWTKYLWNPIIRKTESLKTWKRLYTPMVIKDASGYKVYFSCKNLAGTYVIAYAKVGGFI